MLLDLVILKTSQGSQEPKMHIFTVYCHSTQEN